jgi:hypothetical protein
MRKILCFLGWHNWYSYTYDTFREEFACHNCDAYKTSCVKCGETINTKRSIHCRNKVCISNKK